MTQKSNRFSHAEDKITSIERLYDLKRAGAVTDEEFNTLKEEILGAAERVDSENIADFSNNLFKMDSPPIPIVSERNSYEPPHENDVTEHLTDGIDFDLDLSEDGRSPYIGIDFTMPKETAPLPHPAEPLRKPTFPVSETRRVCAPLKDKYAARDCALMDAEAMEGLKIAPLFLMGVAAAVFFYFVLVEFEVMIGSVTALLIILCLCAGVLPAAVIIPNTVKLNSCSRHAKELNDALAEKYSRTAPKDIPFEYSSPYILDELEDMLDSGEARNVAEALEALQDQLSDPDTLAAEKKLADFAENDEIAARSAALYVAGKKMLYDIE